MRAGVIACALVAALIVTACAAPQHPPTAPEAERPPRDALPDVYKHPPK